MLIMMTCDINKEPCYYHVITIVFDYTHTVMCMSVIPQPEIDIQQCIRYREAKVRNVYFKHFKIRSEISRWV